MWRDVAAGCLALVPGVARADLASAAPSPRWLAALLVIASNYVMHALIWWYPKRFARLCGGRDPVRVFAKLSLAHKPLQLVCVLWLASPGALGRALLASPWWARALGTALVAGGQALNAAVVSPSRHDVGRRRGGDAATTWQFRGDGLRRRRGCDVAVPWSGVAATTWRFRVNGLRRRRRYDADRPSTVEPVDAAAIVRRRVTATP